MTAKQTFRFSIAVISAWLALSLLYPSGISADTGASVPIAARIALDAPTIPSPAAHAEVVTQPARTKKSRKHVHRKKKRINRFLRLSRRIIDDTLICRDEFEYTGTAVDPSINGCLALDQKFQWAFDAGQQPPLSLTEHPFVDADEIGPQGLVIQPLHVYLGGYTPLFKQFFTPLGGTIYLSVGDFPQGTEAWLIEQDWLDDGKTGSALEQLFATDSGIAAAPISYRYDMDRRSALIAGVGWIYDIADTTGMSQAFAQAGYDIAQRVGAVNLTVGYSFNAFTLTGGYIHAIDDRDSLTTITPNGQQEDPSAWSSQLAYSTQFLNRPALFAVGYQKSSETLCHYLPEERYMTKASILLHNKTTLSLEYYQDREYSNGDSLDENEAYGITTRLGFQF